MNRNYDEIMGLKGKCTSFEVTKKYGIPVRTVRNWWQGVCKPTSNSCKSQNSSGNVSRIISTLSAHCSDSFITTEELVELTGLSSDQIGRKSTSLQQYRITHKGQYWWSTLSNTKKIKELMS